MTGYKIEFDLVSPALGVSTNPPPFAGMREQIFRPDQSPAPDQHAVVLYRDVIDANFNVQDFDVTLIARLNPSITTVAPSTVHWTKVSGPTSGELLASDTLSAIYRNPKMGGVYRFHVAIRNGTGTDIAFAEANLVLPLAGADMDSVVQADLVKADAFSTAVRSRYTPHELQKFGNWRRWFWDEHAGDYTGRPSNADTPTVWFYNQVNDDSGFGAVCTWKGRPVRLTKPSNFILGYAMRQIGASREKARRGTGLFTFTETTDRASVGAGWDVANGESYATTVSILVDYIWTHEEEGDKSRKVWPNPNAPDNYKGSSSNIVFDYNLWYGAPGFLFKTR
jgi:hypothetical protein